MSIKIAFLALVLVAFQNEESAERCDNFKATVHKCACHKATNEDCNEPPPEEDRSCKHWSKPDLCKCIGVCDT